MDTSKKVKSILLVGDTFFIPHNIADYFQKQEYHLVSIGSYGSEIFAGIRTKPEIIIVDYEMQYNDPYLVISILHKALPSSLIAIMNGHCTHCNPMAAKAAGVLIVVQKTCAASAFNCCAGANETRDSKKRALQKSLRRKRTSRH